MKKYFESLGLKEGASQEEIQASYDKLSKELDPAKNDNQDFFIEEYKKVQEAYKALSQSSILKNSDSSKRSVASNRDESSSSNSSGSFTVTISPEKIEELKNKVTNKSVIVPNGLKTLCILSIVGSALMIFICFIVIATYPALIAIFMVPFMAIFVLKIIGAFRISNLKKNGYLMYMIPSFIITFLMLFSLLVGAQSADPIYAIFEILSWSSFLYLFSTYKKHLN